MDDHARMFAIEWLIRGWQKGRSCGANEAPASE
jgi:hypothetical protein